MSERRMKNYEEYYELIKVIGTGGFGCIYKGRDRKTKELRAIKIISIEKIKDSLLFQYDTKELKEQLNLCIKSFIQEFEIMKICSKDNNNSVKCYEYFTNKDKFVIIMELCDQNLLQLLKKKIKRRKRI